MQRREGAREPLANDIDPSQAKQEDKRTKISAAAYTFEIVARAWLAKAAPDRASSTEEKVTNWLNTMFFRSSGKSRFLRLLHATFCRLYKKSKIAARSIRCIASSKFADKYFATQ